MQNDTITLDDIISAGSEERDGHSKANSITRSVLAIVSIISSSTLVWMIMRSRAGLTTIYHRILLGMSVADILFSLGLAHFNVTAPSDNDYFVWNARGNKATCTAQGFIVVLGAASALMYSCSLNLYYLVVVKYQKSDKYIREKIEPFLHGVPVVYSSVISITLLAKQNYNNDGAGGSCDDAIYDPPHCAGYEDGQIPEGFSIPCGRGRDGAVLFSYVALFITFFVVPIVISVSLGMIYRAVLQQEKRISQYGANAYTANAHQENASDACGRANGTSLITIFNSFCSCILRLLCRGQSAQNQQDSKSRAVLYRALAYSTAYCLTWSFLFTGLCFNIASTEWPTAIWYLTSILNPLQGFFNFCIFMYPKVLSAKSKGGDGMTWRQAFVKAFLSNGIARTCDKNRVQQNRIQIQQTSPDKNRVQQNRIQIQQTSPKLEEEKSEISPSQMTGQSPDVIPKCNQLHTSTFRQDVGITSDSGDEPGVDPNDGRQGLWAQAVWKSEYYFESTLQMIDANG